MATVNTETAKVEWSDLVELIEDEGDPSGYVHDLMKVARHHISKAYEANEITQAEVGQAYVAMIPSAFQTGLEFAMRRDLTEAQANEQLTDTDRKTAWSNKDLEVKNKDLEVKEQQRLNEADKRLSTAKAREVQEAQRQLYARQKEGYDDKKNQDLFKSQIESWGLMYSSGTLTQVPSIISNDSLSTLYNVLKP